MGVGKKNKRPRALNYSVNKKSPKSGIKVFNAIKHYKKLLKRKNFEGDTKWIRNAFSIINIKLKKYSVNLDKI